MKMSEKYIEVTKESIEVLQAEQTKIEMNFIVYGDRSLAKAYLDSINEFIDRLNEEIARKVE